jgi:hypothetical protein
MGTLHFDNAWVGDLGAKSHRLARARPPVCNRADSGSRATICCTTSLPREPMTRPHTRPFLKQGPAAGDRIYLTFDDGPDPEWTPHVLDLLADADVHGERPSSVSSLASFPL